MPRLASSTGVEWAVLGHDKTNEEEIDDVEDANTPDNLPGGFGDFSLWVLGLSSSQTSKFGSAEGE
jgi:hypothetical protein